jgi:hypothetical protein
MKHFVKLMACSVTLALSAGGGRSLCEPAQSSGKAETLCCSLGRSAEKTEKGAQDRKIILVLQARDYSITVFSRDSEVRYAVSAEGGVALADNLSEAELQTGFPGLYDIVTGIAWAGK